MVNSDRHSTIVDKTVQEKGTVPVSLNFEHPDYVKMVIQDEDFQAIHVNRLKFQITIVSLLRPLVLDDERDIAISDFAVFKVPHKLLGVHPSKPRETMHLTCDMRRIGDNSNDPAKQFFIKRNDL